jgi:tetratricopeptide (TPR) repeat protein
MNYREGMSKSYFQEGLQALSEYWLEQARSRFSYSDKYEPADPKTEQRKSQVDRLLAQQRVTVAKGIEASGRFGAARNEFRLAAALDPANQEAKEGLDRCRKESKAFELLSQAKMEIVRGRIDKALPLIEEGESLTVAQKELFEGARSSVDQFGNEKIYQTALAHERDLEYEAAVATYGELLAKTEYYKDALARKETLEEYIQLAGELYAQAQAATTDEEKIEDLRKISVFWPSTRTSPSSSGISRRSPDSSPIHLRAAFASRAPTRNSARPNSDPSIQGCRLTRAKSPRHTTSAQ